MANITFYIDKNNNDRDGYAPIKANVTIDYKNITKTVGKIKPRYWNKLKQRVRPPRPEEEDNNHEEINDTLDKFQAKAKTYFKACNNQNIEVTPAIVKDYFKGNELNLNKPKKDLWEAYTEFLKAGEIERAYNTNRNRKTIKNYLEKFQQDTGYKMTFESINLVFYDQLKEHVLNTKEHGYNYLSAITDKFWIFR